ncbi:winged helix DNA-binding domain-containing protein [Streptomyces sp. 549]|uniref:winged helix DNA-binding domain-containing protein n=1 Tax=Streptomyces sp. 549 TaxID=3049076 RepID=UPI0024C46E3C|nr:winged helix DNA-binding domain-containing protein [Streptomyces sp. 549]MDK1476893.1 winged helix DNA-binding domain-containing protein [Streptomyces sp. 549]
MGSARRRITADQRRSRLGERHRLAAGARADRVEQVAESLVGLHATDPATVFLAARARMRLPEVAAVERALYEDLTLTRLLCMRRTMFVVPTTLAPTVVASTARAIAEKERAGCLKFLAEGAGWDEAKVRAAEDAVLAVLAERGEATAAQLGAAVPALREQIVVAPGKPYEARQAASARLVRVLAAEGRIRRGRPLGSWTSSQFRWALPASTPAPDGGPVEAGPAGGGLSGGRPAGDGAAGHGAAEEGSAEERAKVRLVHSYLASFGPATAEDVKWWTGWTMTATRRALPATGAEEVELDEGVGFDLPEGAERHPGEAEPWVVLLPALDPTAMGWRHRDWYTDPAHRAALFDRNGNIGPTVWSDGRVVGGWAQRPSGQIVWRLLVDTGRETTAAVEREAAALADWFGDVRTRPAFRTPLERELSA